MIFRLFAKRMIARKKTFAIVAVGILLACTTLSGSVMYFESLRNLALDYTFSTIDSKYLDIKLRARERPVTKQKYDFLDLGHSILQKKRNGTRTVSASKNLSAKNVKGSA